MDEELLTRQLPQSLEAEQAVLGSILIDSRCINDVIGLVRPEDFYLKQNREIYEAIYTMFNFSQTIDPVTVLDKMREMGVYHDNSRDYIQQLMTITPTAANAVRYANIVKDKAILRGLADAAADITQMVETQKGTTSEILEAAEKKIFSVRKGERGDSLEHIGVTLHKVFDRLTELSQSDSAIPGMSTGLRDLDKKINGLNKSDLVLLAARPGIGKTSFALNIARHVAVSNKLPVAVFSLEMSEEELTNRILSSQALVDSAKLKTGRLDADDWQRMIQSVGPMSEAPLYIDDTPGISVTEIRSKCRRLKLEKGLSLVVVDYLQLMEGRGKAESRQQQVSEMSRALKILAKELEVPVLTLSQLSRSIETRQDKTPMLSDLRESGAIEQDADVVMFLHKVEEGEGGEEASPNLTELIVAKHRSGSQGRIKLMWQPQYTTFMSVDTTHEEN